VGAWSRCPLPSTHLDAVTTLSAADAGVGARRRAA
jgi:hypothetical protein